jgi:hypothetical protein
MKELAACGSILPTDTVWKEGVERGVAASKVKHLFAPVPVSVPTAEAPAVQPEAPPPVVQPEPTEAKADVPLAPPVPAAAATWQVPARKGRATAGRGAVLVGQDGVTVKFRKKCTTCGHLDASWTTAPIRNGIMRAGFYCIKCRKHRDIEVHGSLN